MSTVGTGSGREGGGRPVSPVVVAVAVGVALILLVAVLVLGRQVGQEASEAAANEPVTAVDLPAPGAESEQCRALLEALPESLGDARHVDFTDPAPRGAEAYRMPDSEPVIVRCGMEAPPTFVVGVALQEVNGVQWFNQPDPDPAVTASTWVAVDRHQFVAVTLPGGSGTGPIQALSDAIAASMEAVEPDPAPIR